MYLIIEPLLKLVGVISDQKGKGDPLLLFFVTSLVHKLTERMLIFFMLQLKSNKWKSEIGQFWLITKLIMRKNFTHF